MGDAVIVSGGPNGRYTIEMDFGSEKKAGILDALSQLLGKIDTDIATVQNKLDQADALETELKQKISVATEAYIAASNNLPAGSPKPDSAAIKFAIEQLGKAQVKHAPLRLQKKALQLRRAEVLKQIAYWNEFDALERRQAWCVDLTENAPAGRKVATVDIPGETELLLIAPGARTWQASDGKLTAREVMSPEQAYFNAAILPGWQKFKPTYRKGVLTAINRAANTCSVSLDAATSSAQSLNVNQQSSLTNVPIQYLDCNHDAFNVNDRVVVQFQGQDWASPKVIGFVDNPRPCIRWPLVDILFRFSRDVLGEYGTRKWFTELEVGCAGIIQGGTVTVETSRPQNVYWGFSDPSLYRVPAGATASMTVSGLNRAFIGYANWQDGGKYPSGGGPGVFFSARAANPANGEIGGAVIIEKTSAGFSERTESDFFTYESPANPCVNPNRVFTGGYFSKQPIGTIYPSDNPPIYDVEIVRGPAMFDEIVGQYPDVSVTLNGRTRKYEMVTYSQHPSLGQAWILKFAAEGSTDW